LIAGLPPKALNGIALREAGLQPIRRVAITRGTLLLEAAHRRPITDPARRALTAAKSKWLVAAEGVMKNCLEKDGEPSVTYER